MSGKPSAPAYFKLARSFIHDLRYHGPANRRFTTPEAIIWLLEAAAWKPRGDRTRFGAVHNDRGQLSITERALAAQWRWSKTAVHRLLRRLAADGTIVLELARCGPKPTPENNSQSGYARTLITFCNYGKFQGELRAGSGNKNPNRNRSEDQNSPEFSGLIYAVGRRRNERTKPSESSLRTSRGGGSKNDTMPKHGQVSKDRQFIFCCYDDADWNTYAAICERDEGFRPTPTRYLDGKGNWFLNKGESAWAAS